METYYYITNLQGDVIQLVDGDGAVVAAYTYDPYGKVLSATGDLAELNPLRYRGYYADEETGFYYLGSRYYDPEIRRFINADSFVSTGQGFVGYNMFAYCLNNPLGYSDSSGYRPTWEYNAGTIIGSTDSRGGKKLVNITKRLDNFMQSNAEYLSEYVNEHGWTKAAILFYKNVTNGGIWDIKLLDEWQFEKDKIYIYRDHVLRSDDPGNINFGYVGAIIFSETILCAGAGANQIKNHGFKFGSILTFYDDPRDNHMIKYGYALYMVHNQ